jgi:hypothetical protein
VKSFDIGKARTLGATIQRAMTAQQHYLAEHFPAGHRCDVLLNARQKNPTPATIFGVGSGCYGGTIAVQIDNAKQYSRYSIRRLSPEQVLNVRPASTQSGTDAGSAT